MSIKRALATTKILLAAALAAAALAACGSSSTASTAAAAANTGASTSRTKLQACLKEHGVTLPAGPVKGRPTNAGTPAGAGTPPSAGGSSVSQKAEFGGNPNSSSSKKTRAALKACGAKLDTQPGGLVAAAKPSTTAIAKYSACVKQHGYTLPKANTTGSGPVYPRKIESNKRFQTASKACASDLPATSKPSSNPTSGSSE